MSTQTAALKKAMQLLTTTVVKAERADPNSDEFEQLRQEGLAQLEQLLAVHASITPDITGSERKHQGWFEQTVARARAILSVS